MCLIDLDPCDVWRETRRKARKDHRCSCCGRTIRPGETYLVHFSLCDGDSHSAKCCAECESDRDAFSDAHDGSFFAPDFLPMVIENCIEEEPESGVRWGPVLERITGKRA